MQFVEFLELFARIAEQVYKDDPQHRQKDLVDKIAMMMDHMFPLVGQRRKEVQIEIEYESVSEEELNEDLFYI